jgi:RNA polymerase sigma factor (TIGR02999 family)
MNEVTRIMSAIDQGDTHAAEQLLPLVYDELLMLAARRLAHEKPGQTLEATALVHEAYLRLVLSGGHPSPKPPQWTSRGHFFAAAAEAMRRILIEKARRKKRSKHGGDRQRIDLDEVLCVSESPGDDLLDLDMALARLETTDLLAAKLVKLRYFTGLNMPEAAKALGISLRTAERNWTYAKTWLHRELSKVRP